MRNPRDIPSLAYLHIVCPSRNNIHLTKINKLITAQKMQFPADLATSTLKIVHRKLNFSCILKKRVATEILHTH